MSQSVVSPAHVSVRPAAVATTWPQPPPAVHLADVSVRFGVIDALASVDVAIQQGETVALLGPNAAGKSTAIGTMLGLVDPSAGTVHILGATPREAVRRRARRRDAPGRQPSRRRDRRGARRPRSRPLPPAGRPPARSSTAAGLGALVGRRAETLSGGETQRVRFALAIAGDPDLVFLDEPTVAMDVESRRAFWADMRAVAARGRTTLFATHYLDEADQVADRIIVVDAGRVVADGSPASLRATVTERTVRFGWPGADVDELHRVPELATAELRGDTVTLVTRDADGAVRALVAAGIAFRSLEVAGPTLDAAFLALTGTAGARA